MGCILSPNIRTAPSMLMDMLPLMLVGITKKKKKGSPILPRKHLWDVALVPYFP